MELDFVVGSIHDSTNVTAYELVPVNKANIKRK